MSKQGRPSQDKRKREKAKQEKRKEKLERRAVRKAEKGDRDTDLANGIDPDLIGIVAGPQPILQD